MPSRCRRVRDRRPIHKNALKSTRVLDQLAGDILAVDIALGAVEVTLADHEGRLVDLEAGVGGSANLTFYEATCASSVQVGDVAMFSGGIVVRADPTMVSNMPAVGIVVAKPASTTARVQVGMLLRSVYSGLTPGKRYFVGLNGRPSLTAPTATPGVPVAQQVIGTAVSSTVLNVQPATMMFIDEI